MMSPLLRGERTPGSRQKSYGRPSPLVSGLIVSFVVFLGLHSFSTSFRDAYPSTLFHDTPSPSETCQRDPFKSPGYLTASTTEDEKNRWNPLAPGCTTPQLTFDVRNRDPSLEWMRGRTVLLFGDSVDRYRMLDFCEIVNGTYTIIVKDSPLAPPEVEPDFPPEAFTGQRNTGRSRTCYIEEYDFTMISSFHYGIGDEDFFRTDYPGYSPPGLFEDRLELLVLPLLEKLNRPGGMVPDLVSVSAFEWDVAEWVKQPRYKGAPYNESHSHIDRAALLYTDALVTSVPSYTRRLAITARAVREAFPTHGPILWRMPHDYGGRELPLGQFAHLVDQITRDVLVNDPGFELDETELMLRGSFATNWMRDLTHPAKVPHGHVWSDCILFKLRESVLS